MPRCARRGDRTIFRHAIFPLCGLLSWNTVLQPYNHCLYLSLESSFQPHVLFCCRFSCLCTITANVFFLCKYLKPPWYFFNSNYSLWSIYLSHVGRILSFRSCLHSEYCQCSAETLWLLRYFGTCSFFKIPINF